MRDFDALMKETLDAEERELLAQMGEEPGWFSQIFGLFTGKIGWTNIVLAITQAVMFIAGIWAAVHFFNATEPLEALRWGLPAAVLMILAAVIKLSMLPVVYVNRVLREVKLLQLQLAQKH
ncbi:DUF6768 family protein [Sphingomicrobium flavum]|uniref:DUF6768 family protein n=1 Tax=Sphingomicrobium flavum TaxID=1229164 RepID=UPI0021ADAE6B|nr:DUF6768 family protein [Sphingomicrobium flavum]